MIVLIYALAIMCILYAIYKAGFGYKIINSAIALTAIILILIVVPPQIKIMMVIVLLVYGVSRFVTSDVAHKS